MFEQILYKREQGCSFIHKPIHSGVKALAEGGVYTELMRLWLFALCAPIHPVSKA